MIATKTTLQTLAIFGLCFSQILTFAQDIPRQKVYSLVKQYQTTEWYTAQNQLWKQFTQENPSDAEAWLNQYMAMRMLKIYQQGYSQRDLDSLVDAAEKAIPESFEYHYLRVYNNGYRDPEIMEKHIQIAQKLGPDRPELFDDLCSYYELKRDQKNSEAIAKKWFASNDISPGLYNYTYNLLMSVEDQAILFTHGDNDTYPTWVLQRAKGVKSNVLVINTSLMFIDDYRNLLLKELGIEDLKIDPKDSLSYHQLVLRHLQNIKQQTNRPVYIAISGHSFINDSLEGELHLTGLAYKWGPKFDNIATIKKNYEKYFHKDYLSMAYTNDISQHIVDQNSSNYILPLVILYHHYVESEDSRHLELKKILLDIGEKNDKTKEVESLLNKA